MMSMTQKESSLPELLPCWECGAKAVFRRSDDMVRVICTECGTRTVGVEISLAYAAMDEAATLWNALAGREHKPDNKLVELCVRLAESLEQQKDVVNELIIELEKRIFPDKEV